MYHYVFQFNGQLTVLKNFSEVYHTCSEKLEYSIDHVVIVRNKA